MSSAYDFPHFDSLLTEIEAAQLRKQSVRTLQAERLRGGGCPYAKLGRSVRYRRSDVLRFIEDRVRSYTGASHTAGAVATATT
jgi:Helix-turn-helix domain